MTNTERRRQTLSATGDVIQQTDLAARLHEKRIRESVSDDALWNAGGGAPNPFESRIGYRRSVWGDAGGSRATSRVAATAAATAYVAARPTR